MTIFISLQVFHSSLCPIGHGGYIKTTQIAGRPDITTPFQAEILRETQQKIRFNTLDYKVFIDSNIAYYEKKRKSSLDGFGPSSKGGRGTRVKLLENVVSELKEELDRADARFPDDRLDKILDPTIRLDNFLILSGNLSVYTTQPGSQIMTTSEAMKAFNKLQNEKPLFNYSRSEKIIKPKKRQGYYTKIYKKIPFYKNSNSLRYSWFRIC